jgi:hypothetical protein
MANQYIAQTPSAYSSPLLIKGLLEGEVFKYLDQRYNRPYVSDHALASS